ncbi:MAG TPA: saccharopine dehydrogenase C-terminal domain-containing protein [Chitinophagaceae bacterium]|nr:saccharopine dehydrogenase C-terminal domain-containing protein [Chitinophagaceae bacterium]
MQHILILGAGKSASILIETLLQEAQEHDWFVHLADVELATAEKKIAGHARGAAYGIDLNNETQLDQLVSAADAVISMLPPPLHIKAAMKCLQYKKHFLNASYLSPDMQALNEEVKAAGLSFLVEMGLDPGIDHMSAMEMIHGILNQGGNIFMFRSHCGGLVSPESDNNPWHYKISWNPRNIILAGKDGAHYLSDGEVSHVPYSQLFDPQRTVHVPGYGDWAWYPNRDSLPYIKKYELDGVSDFVRTTLRHPDFANGWKKIVDLDLTNDTDKTDTNGVSLSNYFKPYLKDFSNWDESLKEQFRFLDLTSDDLINKSFAAPADVLQSVLEKKLALSETDKDMIIMLHEVGYRLETEDDEWRMADEEVAGGRLQVPGKLCFKKASLVVKGEDSVHTAMAKTVGLPLAIAVKNILNGKITRKGVFIPIYPDVYEIVLRDLEKKGIRFTITE